MDHLCFCVLCCHSFVYVQCCLVVTCCETADLLFVMFNCVFVTFPCGILGQAGVVLDCIDS